MERHVRKCLVSLMCMIMVLSVRRSAMAEWPYNYPSYSKVKVTRNASGHSWLYLEFMWGKEGEKNPPCPPNFEKGKAVEFEVVITPKCFLQPQVGKDKKFVFNDLVSLK